jgi:hypothetical protein
LFFSKRTHWPKSLSYLEFGDVVVTRWVRLDVWPGEIPPGQELEWVDDDE